MNPIVGDLLWSGAILAFLGGCFLVTRLLQKRRGLQPETSRKLVHISMGVAVLPLPWLFRYSLSVIILGGVAVAALLALRVFASGDRQMGGVLYRVGRLRSVGELVYPVAVVITYLLAPAPEYYVIPILVLTFADSMAALVGSGYAKHQLAADAKESPKSFEGAVAFAFSAFVCMVSPLLLLSDLDKPVILMVSVLIAVIATLLELVCAFGLDNLLIPVVISLFLSRLSAFSYRELLTCCGLTALYMAIALVFSRFKNITRLGVVAALLTMILTTLLGSFFWVAAPLLLFFTYSFFPALSAEERVSPVNYYIIESILFPGLFLVLAGSPLNVPPLIFWAYSVYYACMTAANYHLRVYHYHSRLRRASALIALLRTAVIQLAPTGFMYRAAYGAWPRWPLAALAAAAVLAVLGAADWAVRRFRFPDISLRLGLICSIGSVAAVTAMASVLYGWGGFI